MTSDGLVRHVTCHLWDRPVRLQGWTERPLGSSVRDRRPVSPAADSPRAAASDRGLTRVRSAMLRRALAVSPRRLTRLAAAVQPAPERDSAEDLEELELPQPEPQPEPERWILVRPGLALLQRLGLQPAGWLSEDPR